MRRAATHNTSIINGKANHFFSTKNSFGSLRSKSTDFFTNGRLQKKELTAGQPGDTYEVEADAVADKVVQRLAHDKGNDTPFFDAVSRAPSIQHKCTECSKEEVQKKEEETPEEELVHRLQKKDEVKEGKKKFRAIKIIFNPSSKSIIFVSKEGKRIRTAATYSGKPKKGVYRHQNGELLSEDRSRMGGKAKNGDIIKWVLKGYELIKVPDYKFVVIDSRLTSGSGNIRLNNLELADLTELTQNIDDYEFRRLRQSKKGGRLARNFKEAKRILVDFKHQKKEYELFGAKAALVENKFYGLEETYKLYRLYKCYKEPTVSSMPFACNFIHKDANIKGFPSQGDLKNKLVGQLKMGGFNSIKTFEKYINSFEDNFTKESTELAYRFLDNYKQMAHSEYQRYRNKKTAVSLYSKLEKARKLKGKSNKEYARAVLEGSIMAQINATTYENLSNKEYAKVAHEHPILMGMPSADVLDERKYYFVKHYFTSDILKIINSINGTRKAITKKPEYIYKLDRLTSMAYSQKGIKKNSILDLIIQDKRRAIEEDESFMENVLLVASLALMILTLGGSGVVTVVAETALATIGTYSAVDAMDQYLRDKSSFQSGLSAQDPSVFWVAIAVLGAGVDMGSAAYAFSKVVKYGNELNDSTKLAKRFKNEKLVPSNTALTDDLLAIDQKLKSAILKKQITQGKIDATFNKSASIINSTISSNGVMSAKVLRLMSQLAYESAKFGYYRFDEFLLNLKRNKIAKKIDWEQVPKDQMRRLKGAFEEGLEGAIDEKRLLYEADLADDVEPSFSSGRKIKKSDEAVAVEPRARGYAIEDQRLDDLFGSGWEGLPNWYKAIDGYKGGKVRVKGDVKQITGAQVVSIKSTNITSVKALKSKFLRDLEPMMAKEFKNKTRPIIVFKKVAKKRLELIFEQGFQKDVLDSKELLEVLKHVKRIARSKGIAFEWFITAANGSIYSGEKFIRDMKKTVNKL